MEEKNRENNLKFINFLMLLDPVILALIAVFMKRFLSYQPSPEIYEINSTMRFIQYFLYLSGLAVFFFIDGITHFIQRKIVEKSKPSSPILFNIISLSILDYIAVAGFAGFIISGNISWVVIFCAISFFSRFRFLPFKRNLKSITSDNN